MSLCSWFSVDVMMARVKRINVHFDGRSEQVYFFFASVYFLKEIENMFFMFLLSYRNTHESLGEL